MQCMYEYWIYKHINTYVYSCTNTISLYLSNLYISRARVLNVSKA